MTSAFDEEGRTPWYDENNVELFLNDKAAAIDTESKTVTGASGRVVHYDVAVFGKSRLCELDLLNRAIANTFHITPKKLLAHTHLYLPSPEGNVPVFSCTGCVSVLFVLQLMTLVTSSKSFYVLLLFNRQSKTLKPCLNM